jgi:hypothetical protein
MTMTASMNIATVPHCMGQRTTRLVALLLVCGAAMDCGGDMDLSGSQIRGAGGNGSGGATSNNEFGIGSGAASSGGMSPMTGSANSTGGRAVDSIGGMTATGGSTDVGTDGTGASMGSGSTIVGIGRVTAIGGRTGIEWIPSGGRGGIAVTGGTGLFCESPIFQAGPPGIEVERDPVYAAVGDWNGDGRLDLAITGNAKAKVSVLVGAGDGTFSFRMDYDTGDSPTSIAVGDLNGDGHPDLITANSPARSVSVLLGKGDGSFAFSVDYPLAANSEVDSVLLADWNGDGNTDLIASNSVLLGQGDGTFALEVDLEYAVAAAGDLNGDGNLDLVTRPFRNVGAVLATAMLGKGDGTFNANESTFSLPCYFDATMALADFNADGWLDLATVENDYHPEVSSELKVLLGNGDGTFVSQAEQGLPGSVFPVISVGDINADGRLDLMTRSVLWTGNGDGTFTPDGRSTVLGESFLALGDWNGDGKLDLATTHYDNPSSARVKVWTNNGDGTFGANLNYPVGSGARDISLTDLNGDGKLDIVSANYYSNSVSVLLGKDDGSFATQSAYAVVDYPECIKVMDLNGDGKADLVTANDVYTGHRGMSVLLGNGDGTFNDTPITTISDSYSCNFALGDLDDDGKLDLVMQNHNAQTSVMLGNGDGTFSVSLTDTVPSGDSLTLNEVNGDGKLDLVFLDGSSSTVAILQGNGDGTFASRRDYSTAKGPVQLAIGDLNHDGNPDLVTNNQYALNDPKGSGSNYTNSVSVLLGTGNGTMARHVSYALPESSRSVSGAMSGLVLGDLNGDGMLDLAVGGTDDVTVLMGAGDGTFACAKTCTDVKASGPMALGDVNRDGKLDLVTALQYDNNVAVFLNSH